jgi:hypothetical protein
MNGKRRYSQGLPDKLQPATKDAFDFAITDKGDKDDEI